MSERDDNAGAARPMTTGEFRAAPDVSASTAQFQAFAGRSPAESEAPWEMKAPARNVGRLIALVVGIAVVLGVLAVLVLQL